ncbi:hypothetical protein MASB_33960 [Mycobacteroides abscessus subsp. bolletii BD]|nr:hypothetical protein MASB_33960 [Mycobacteroides abscessus subsp. bolletii BD]
MTPYYQDDSVTLHHGDALDVAMALPDGAADCIVTSPPYFGLRDYGVPPAAGLRCRMCRCPGCRRSKVPAMTCALGLEPTPNAYIGHLVLLFSELRRVLADDGSLWVNLGDSYSFGSTPLHNTNAPNKNRDGSRDNASEAIGASLAARKQNSGLPAKNLIGVPWRVAFALQGDGWFLRNDNIWNKPNPMPESVNDRFSSKHEHVFMLTKSRRYWFDLDAVREQYVTTRASALTWDATSRACPVRSRSIAQAALAVPKRPHPETRRRPISANRQRNGAFHERGRNPGDVWTIPTQPFRTPISPPWRPSSRTAASQPAASRAARYSIRSAVRAQREWSPNASAVSTSVSI